MDLSCNETMINDVENKYNLYEDYHSDGKSATSTGDQNQQPSLRSSAGISTKLFSNACADPTFLREPCLTNLLTSQKRYKTSCNYFNTVQKTVTPQMRKIVAEWVIEVSFLFIFLFIFNGVICVAVKLTVEKEVEVNYTSPLLNINFNLTSTLSPFLVDFLLASLRGSTVC